MPAAKASPSERRSLTDVIVVGASAGGVEALSDLAGRLPADLPAAVLIVLHIPAHSESVLPRILSRRGRLPAVHPRDGEALRPGHIYIAPPDYHLLVQKGRVRLTRGPAENGHRPAIDTLFRSAAISYGSRAAGVVLTGTLDDGTAGLLAIKEQGGLALVQDPDDALFQSMPRSAIENVAVDYVQPLPALADTLVRLAHMPGEDMPGEDMPVHTAESRTEVEIAALDMTAIEAGREGQPSPYSCPDCHGVLWEVEEGRLLRFRCRTGHAFSPESLVAAQSGNLEEALWVAVRALEESAALVERLQARASERGHTLAAERFGMQAGDAHRRAQVIRTALAGGELATHSLVPSVSSSESSPR